MIMRSDPSATFKQNKFLLAENGSSPSLMISDYKWWAENEREILNWMAENLPRGIDHHQGMFVYFDTNQERLHFLLRWS